MSEEFEIPANYRLTVRHRGRFHWEAKLSDGWTDYRCYSALTRDRAIREVLKKYRKARIPWEEVT